MLCLVLKKACKRCGGDLSPERDNYGTYLECIQCGASWSESDLATSDTLKETKHQLLALTGDSSAKK